MGEIKPQFSLGDMKLKVMKSELDSLKTGGNIYLHFFFISILDCIMMVMNFCGTFCDICGILKLKINNIT